MLFIGWFALPGPHGCLTVPREVHFDAALQVLQQAPAKELASLRGAKLGGWEAARAPPPNALYTTHSRGGEPLVFAYSESESQRPAPHAPLYVCVTHILLLYSRVHVL